MNAATLPAEPERFDSDTEYLGGGNYVGAMSKERNGDYVLWKDYDALRQSLDAAIGRAEKDAADAKRYRWLRDESPSHTVNPPTPSMQSGHGIKVLWQAYGVDDRVKPRCVLFGEALDTAVDGALLKRDEN